MPKPAAATPETEPKVMAAMLLEARKPVTATYAGRGHPGDGGDQGPEQAVRAGQAAAPQDRPDPGEKHQGQQTCRLLPPGSRDRLPGLPPQQPGRQEAAGLRELPRPALRRPQPLQAGPAGGLSPAVHGVPQGHGDREAGRHQLHRLPQGKALNRTPSSTLEGHRYVNFTQEISRLVGRSGGRHDAGPVRPCRRQRAFRRLPGFAGGAVRRHPLHRLPQVRGGLQQGQRAARAREALRRPGGAGAPAPDRRQDLHRGQPLRERPGRQGPAVPQDPVQPLPGARLRLGLLRARLRQEQQRRRDLRRVGVRGLPLLHDRLPL
ncbi:MAG: hypothetical protein MZV70_19935 [Desulfobacterales bacterium]|nr:hypothetical protein [Desulfobacterales bacterium]